MPITNEHTLLCARDHGKGDRQQGDSQLHSESQKLWHSQSEGQDLVKHRPDRLGAKCKERGRLGSYFLEEIIYVKYISCKCNIYISFLHVKKTLSGSFNPNQLTSTHSPPKYSLQHIVSLLKNYSIIKSKIILLYSLVWIKWKLNMNIWIFDFVWKENHLHRA